MIIPINKPDVEQAKTEHENDLKEFCDGNRIDQKQCEVLLERFSEFCKTIGV